MNEAPLVGAWSTRAVRPPLRFGAWREMVSQTHLAWDLPSRVDGRFNGSVEQQRLGAARIIRCMCDPCGGRRSQPLIGRDDDEYVGVLHVIEGHEVIGQCGREAVLQAGDFCIWDSRWPMSFEVCGNSRLSKMTLMLPRSLLRNMLPGIDAQVARRMSGTSGRSALFVNYLHVLARELPRVPEPYLPSLLSTTLDLLATTLLPDNGGSSVDPARQQEGTPQRHREQLERAQAYITLNLGDPELSPARIAAALGVSTRQLHRVFEEAGLSVERWTWTERLSLCRRQLLVRAKEPVSAVAFRCGFNDAAHFSRAFREQFGCSPREFRRTALGLD